MLYPNGSILTIEGQLYYNNNPKDGHLLVSDSSGLISFATPSVYGAGLTLTGSTLSVTSGIIYIFNKTTGIPTYYTTLELARDGSVSGDTIYVNAGNYTVTTTATNGLSKEGVNWYFETGAIVTKATSGIMFGNGTLPQYILGYGSFYGTTLCGSVFQSLPGSSVIEGLICSSTSAGCISSSGTKSTITFREIISTSGIAVSNLGTYNVLKAVSIKSTANHATFNFGIYSIVECSELISTTGHGYYNNSGGSNVSFICGNITGLNYGIYSDGNVYIKCSYINALYIMAGNCDFQGSGGSLTNLAGNVKGGFFNSIIQTSTGYLESSTYGSGSVITCQAGRMKVTINSETTSNSPKLVITGGLCTIDGKWIDDDCFNYSTISGGTLVISPTMLLQLGNRRDFITMSGTSVVNLSNCTIKLTGTNTNYAGQVGSNCAIRWTGGTLISNGATIMVPTTETHPILAEAPNMNFKVLSGGFSTNYVNTTFNTLDAKKKKYKITVTNASNTSVVLNDLSGLDETFTALVATYPTIALLAQRLVTLINASGTLDITASQDTPGTDVYFYVEADVAGTNINVNNGNLVNCTYTVLRGNSYAITNSTGGYIIEDLDILN
jgi:hypothetical protein